MPARRKKKLSASYTSLNKVRLIRAGKPYFDCLLQMIASAQQSIHLQTYIFDDDETGKLVAQALKEAVQRKVQVYLLADGYASRGMSRSFVNELSNAGIHFRFFDPILKSRHFYFGRRLHHKIAVADTRYALVGGVNITDRYNDRPGKAAWLDFALYLEGEAAQQLCTLCWKTWQGYPAKAEPSPCGQPVNFKFEAGTTSQVSIRRNDWVRRKNEISSAYIQLFRSAQSHITILCSYFLPGNFIRRQMSYAAKRGVKIRVITTGISDIRLSKYAERYLYDWLLRKGIGLYEYQPAVLHGKIAVCDSEWLTVGSYNINNISAYASIELNLNVRDAGFAEQTENLLQQIIDQDCIAITKEYHRRSKNLIRRLVRWMAYEFIRLTLFLFTFYFRRGK